MELCVVVLVQINRQNWRSSCKSSVWLILGSMLGNVSCNSERLYFESLTVELVSVYLRNRYLSSFLSWDLKMRVNEHLYLFTVCSLLHSVHYPKQQHRIKIPCVLQTAGLVTILKAYGGQDYY